MGGLFETRLFPLEVKMMRRRHRGRFNIKSNESNGERQINSSSIIKGLLLEVSGLILNDIRKPNSKIKRLFSKINPKIIYDDRKEIKNAKFEVLENKKI